MPLLVARQRLLSIIIADCEHHVLSVTPAILPSSVHTMRQSSFLPNLLVYLVRRILSQPMHSLDIVAKEYL